MFLHEINDFGPERVKCLVLIVANYVYFTDDTLSQTGEKSTCIVTITYEIGQRMLPYRATISLNMARRQHAPRAALELGFTDKS